MTRTSTPLVLVAAAALFGAAALVGACKKDSGDQAAGDKAAKTEGGDDKAGDKGAGGDDKGAHGDMGGDKAGAAAKDPGADGADPIAAALAHPDRPAADKERDAARKPAEMLKFFGVEPGMKVAEIMGGRGWYAEVLSRVIGPEGTVYVHNNSKLNAKYADEVMKAMLAKPGHENIKRWDKELDDLALPAGELDYVQIMLFYHDTYWMGTDRAKMNKAIFDGLKPGGIYAVVDHHAEAGSGDRDVKTLHRVDAELVKKEVLAAGFELVEESDLLKHPEDDRKTSAVDEAMRGKTDRFVYKFRKPEQ